MSRRARATGLLLLAFPTVALAQSWTDATRTRMVADALKISPPALRDILDHYRKDLLRGMIDPSSHETEEVHFQLADGRAGLGGVAIDRKVKDIRDLLARRAAFDKITYEMGVLSHLVADVEFPLNASDADPREPLYRDAYCRYIERMLDRIPFVLDRDPPKTLEKDDIRGFVRDIARRAGKNYALIGPAFKDDGTPKSASALDERSVPFGIASLSYSHSTSDIAWIWRHVWVSINGDMQGTPFLGAPPPEKVKDVSRPKKPKRASPKADAGPSPTPSGSPAPTASPTPPASAAGGSR